MERRDTQGIHILDAMAGYAKGARLGFHMPGHQQGRGLPAVLSDLIKDHGLALDLTELPGLDNLSAPASSIDRSRRALADLTGAGETYYLVNGATGGLEAAMLAMSDAATTTLIPSHCHTAIISGLILTGSMPVILPCKMDAQWGLPIGVDKAATEAFLADGSDDEALWISLNPTYHGAFADLAWEQGILAAHPGWLWLADEAHGAHLPYVKPYDAGQRPSARRLAPLSALRMDAHVVVHSIHKMGTGFTQTGVLHCNHPGVASRVQQALNITQSSSPSYLLLASLDAWRLFLEEGGAGRLQEAEDLAMDIAGQIRGLGGYRLWQDEIQAGCFTDPRKITLSASPIGLDGYALADLLSREQGIDVELAAAGYCLLIVNVGHTAEDAARLVGALRTIQKQRIGAKEKTPAASGIDTTIPERQTPWSPTITPREAFFAKRRRLRLSEARGSIAAAAVTPYPPGIPLLYPGMEVTGDAVEAIESIKNTGQSCAGVVEVDGQLFVDIVDD